MDKIFKYIFVLVLVTGVYFNVGTVSATEINNQRVLIWADEFDGKEIDKNKWSVTNNIYLENGSVVLPVSYNQSTKQWSQAWLTTQGRFGFKYGRLEARIKMTAYPGEFPAFWTMGYNKQSRNAENDIDGCRWSKCGEIDIMEEYNPNGTTANPGAAIHWCNGWLDRNQSKGIGKFADFDTRQWHIYAMEWDENGIAIFYDDISVGYIEHQDLDYYNDMNPFEMPHQILFDNLINDTDVANKSLTSKMWIDWVRVYAPKTQNNIVIENKIELVETGSRKAIKSGRIAVGDSAYMDVLYTPENVINQSYQLLSANENIISVNGGVLTAVSPGVTAIAAVTPEGKTSFMILEVYYDTHKNNLSNVNLENASLYLCQKDAWYWGENSKEINTKSNTIHTGLIKVQPNATYEISTLNQCLSAKINIIEYGEDGRYIKWSDYSKDGILKTGKDAKYIRINMILSKSGITMNYGDYMEYLKYSSFSIKKK